MTNTQRAPGSAAEARRVAAASAVGTTIEWYDFFIYGAAAALVFSGQFFPNASPLVGTIAAFSTFAIGFMARPLGAVIMGHFGDRIGRKSMLVMSLLLMGVATFGIGLLPTYAQIGIWAPVLLVALRFIQGFALGGEWAGAVLMTVEHAQDGSRGRMGGFVALGLPMGMILSNVVFLIVTVAAGPEAFQAWAWRVPFLLSAVLVVIGMFIRLRVAESPIFEEARHATRERRMPVIEVMRRDTRTVLLAAGSYMGVSALGYIVIVYFLSYATNVLGLNLRQILGILVVGSVTQAIAIVYSASLSDRFGRRRVMLYACTSLVAASFAFFPLADTRSIPLIVVAVFLTMVTGGTYIGPQAAAFAEQFDTSVRYSGTSLSLQIGTILGGALAPLIAVALYGTTNSSWSITVYLTVLSFISLLCVRALKETYRRDLRTVTEPKPEAVNSSRARTATSA